MKKLCTFFLAMTFAVTAIKAQHSLEQVNLSPLGFEYNTLLMGINNNGFVCGYVHDPTINDTTGFVITPEGKVIYITAAITGPGTYGVKAVSINDSNMVLVNFTHAGGTAGLHRVFVNNHMIVNDWPITNNIGQSYVKAFHLNNKGDITGWYQTGVNRWMFTLHDGIPPAGFNAWQAWRYNYYINPNFFYFNTMAGAMDTNRVATGFYIDGALNIPFLYDEISATFYELNGNTWCHPWGKNNSGKIVGEYKNGNGFLNAFVASPTYTPGNINSGQLNLTSLSNLFHDPNTQSIARAINDKDEAVGSFIDVNTGKWAGFIYRPNGGEYKIQNYSFNKHVWTQMENTTGAPGSGMVWTTNFYGGFNYAAVDPFANNGLPLVEPHIAADPAIVAALNIPATSLPSEVSVDWNSFMKEIVNSSTYYANSQNPAQLPTYRYMDKRDAFLNWISNPNKYCDYFGGICYGFAGTSAMHYVDDTYLNSTFNIGAGTNLTSFTDNSADAITAIERVYLRQFEPGLSAFGVDKMADVLPWSGMYRYKHVWPKGDSLAFRQLYIGWHTPQNYPDYLYHSIFPYKIKTPQKLPFYYNNIQQFDTIFIYDSNDPTSQNEHLLINTNRFYNTIDSVSSAVYGQSPDYGLFVAFNEVAASNLMAISNTALKKSRGLDSLASLALSPNSHYMMQNAATLNSTYYDVTGYHNNNTANVSGIAAKANIPIHISSFFRDTISELQISSSSYQDSLMNFTFKNDKIRMSLLRKALPGETDNATSKNRYMSYGNPDNISKTLVADFSQIDHSLPNSCIITVSNLTVAAHDSIITISPADYQYQIIHPTNDSLTYTVNVIAIYNDTVKQFTASGIPFSGPTSHIIDPYYNGAQGPQTIIKIDNGIDAIDDDTLFVLQVPLGVQDGHKNVEYIRMYPNPTSDRFNVQIAKQSTEDYAVVFTDIYGKVLLNENVKHETGTNSYSFDISKYSKGLYFVMVFDKNQKAIFVEKLMKE